MRKKTIKGLLAILTALFVVSTATACLAGDESSSSSSSSTNSSSAPKPWESTGTPPPPPASSTATVDSVELDEISLELDVYEYFQLTATVNGGETPTDTVVWETSNSSVATVVDGLVTAVAEGNAVIGATVSGVSAYCQVAVVDTGAAPTIELQYEEVGISLNDEFAVEAYVNFKGQPVTNAVELTWSVVAGFATDVVEITPAADGLSASIKGVKVGDTRIQVYGELYGVPLIKALDVAVVDASVAIEVTSTSEYISGTSGGYNVFLNLGTEGVKTVNPQVVKKVNGTVDTSATFTWNSDDVGIATVDNSGNITAVAVGETVVTGTSGDSSVKFFVTVEKTYSGDLQNIYFETASGAATVELPGSIGAVKDIKISGTSVFSSYDANSHTVTLNQTNLRTLGTGVMQANFFFEDGGNMGLDVGVYTKVLRTVADIDNWGAYAKAENSNAKIWGGHFILANNISYNKVYTPFMNYAVLGDGYFGYVRNCGFNGIFDGQGYNIEGVTIPSSPVGGGFVGQLMSGGIFKNVSFTKARVDGAAGLIASCSNGTIENVYAQVNYLGQGWVADPTGVFVSKDNMAEARVVNCFAQIDDSFMGEYTFTIGKAHENLGILQNVYTVGGNYTNAWGVITVDSNTNPIKNVAAGYASYAALKEGGVDFTGWIGDFWTVKNGIPYPKNLPFPGGSDSLSSTITVETGETVTALKSLGAAIELTFDDPNSVVESVGDFNTFKIKSTAAAGSTFSVSLKSVFESAPYKTITFTVVASNKLTLAEKQYVEMNDGSVTSSVFDLSSLEDSLRGMTLTGVTALGSAVDIVANNGLSSIAVANAPFGALALGSTTEVKFNFQKTEGGEVIASTVVSANAMVVTLAIGNYTEFDSFIDMAYRVDAAETYWGGYYVLSNSFDYSEGITSGEYRWYVPKMHYSWWTNKFGTDTLWADGRAAGFRGTFDGQGYNIDRVAIGASGALEGSIFGLLAAQGVVKNVSFTHAYHGGWGGFLTQAGNGRIENVYIHADWQAEGDAPNPSGFIFSKDSMADARVVNVYVKVDSAATTQTYNIGMVHDGYGIYQGVYTVGGNATTTPWNVISTGSGQQNVCGAYADEAAFKAANIDFSAWADTSFWALDANGLPIPECLA